MVRRDGITNAIAMNPSAGARNTAARARRSAATRRSPLTAGTRAQRAPTRPPIIAPSTMLELGDGAPRSPTPQAPSTRPTTAPRIAMRSTASVRTPRWAIAPIAPKNRTESTATSATSPGTMLGRAAPTRSAPRTPPTVPVSRTSRMIRRSRRTWRSATKVAAPTATATVIGSQIHWTKDRTNDAPDAAVEYCVRRLPLRTPATTKPVSARDA